MTLPNNWKLYGIWRHFQRGWWIVWWQKFCFINYVKVQLIYNLLYLCDRPENNNMIITCCMNSCTYPWPDSWLFSLGSVWPDYFWSSSADIDNISWTRATANGAFCGSSAAAGVVIRFSAIRSPGKQFRWIHLAWWKIRITSNNILCICIPVRQVYWVFEMISPIHQTSRPWQWHE